MIGLASLALSMAVTGAVWSLYPQQCSSSGQTVRMAGVFEGLCGSGGAGDCDVSKKIKVLKCGNGDPLRDVDVRITGYQIERAGGGATTSYSMTVGLVSSQSGLSSGDRTIVLRPKIAWLAEQGSLGNEFYVRVHFEILGVTTSYSTQIIRSGVTCQKTADSCSGDVVIPGAAGADLVTAGGLKSFTISSLTPGGTGSGWANVALNTTTWAQGSDVLTTMYCEAPTGNPAVDTFCSAEVIALRGPAAELAAGGPYENWAQGTYSTPQSSQTTIYGESASVALCGLTGFSFPVTFIDRISGIWAGFAASSCSIMGPNTVASYYYLAFWGRGDMSPYIPFSVSSTLAYPFSGYSARIDTARLK